MIITGITTAIFGLIGGMLGSLSILAAVRTIGGVRMNRPQLINSETWREVIRYIVPMLPTMVVYMVQDPLVLWLALTFGGQAPLSETFALGRIGAIYAVLGNFTVAVVAPRLAGISDDGHFARMAALFLGVLVLICLGAVMLAYFAPSLLLVLIGPKYAHLQLEVVLAIGAASFSVLLTFLATANRLRGWVRLEPAVAVCQVAAIFILATHWSFNDSANVLRLTLVLAGLSCLGALTISVVGLLSPSTVRAV
jgi:hypothetical protein